MKNRIGVIVLILCCIGLAFGLFLSQKQAAKQKSEATEAIGNLSNNLFTTTSQLGEQRQVGAELEKDIEKHKQAYSELTNAFARVSADLTQVNGALATTEASLKAKEEEVKKRDAKIAELENQNQALDKQALDLAGALTNLTVQIADTQKKLTASEGDKAFLEKELKRLMSEKAELERQFNDLTVMRAQVSRLKEELSIARRIEWIRKGLFATSDQKGAQKLMQGAAPAAQPKAAKPSYDLNVEVNADGTIRVIPPATNAPASTNSPP